MDKATLRALSKQLSQLADDIDSTIHDDERVTLWASPTEEYEDNFGEWHQVYDIDTSEHEGKIQVVGWDNVETLAGWLGAKISKYR